MTLLLLVPLTLQAAGRNVGFFCYPDTDFEKTARVYAEAERDLGNYCFRIRSINEVNSFFDRIYLIGHGWKSLNGTGGVVVSAGAGEEAHDVMLPFPVLRSRMEDFGISDLLVDSCWAGLATEDAEKNNSPVRVLASCSKNEKLPVKERTLSSFFWKPGEEMPECIQSGENQIHPQMYLPETCQRIDAVPVQMASLPIVHSPRPYPEYSPLPSSTHTSQAVYHDSSRETKSISKNSVPQEEHGRVLASTTLTITLTLPESFFKD